MIKQERRVVIRAFSKQYRQAKKKEKSELLNRLVVTTGYSRKHLMDFLPKALVKKKIRQKHISRYALVFKPLRELWAISNFACGKRLKPILPTYLAALRRHKELIVSPEERRLLLQISSA